MEPTIYKPSIYKGTGIYKTGAGGGGGGGGIPDDVNLFEIIKSKTSNPGQFSIPFGSTNKDKAFVIKYLVNSYTSPGNIYLFSGNDSFGNAPQIQLGMSGITIGGNRGGNTNFYNGDAATNTIYTQAIKNNRLFNFFTNETKKNIPYAEFTINRLYLLGYIQGIISLYNFAVLDENDNYIIKLYPAKKGNDIGLFDTISNTFYAATNQANYELINQII